MTSELKLHLKAEVELGKRFELIAKLRKQKNRSVKAWKEPCKFIMDKHGKCTGNLYREFCCIDAEAYAGQKKVGQYWEKICPIHPDTAFAPGDEIKLKDEELEFDFDLAEMRRCCITEDDFMWRNEWMDDYEERRQNADYKQTKDDEVGLAKVKEVDQWEKTIRSSIMNDKVLEMFSTDFKKSKELMSIIEQYVSDNPKGMDFAAASTRGALESVGDFASAYNTVVKGDIISLHEAEKVKRFFVAANFTNRTPRYIKTWYECANENKEFAKLLKAAIAGLRADTGEGGSAIKDALTKKTCEWKDEDVSEWMKKLPEWRASFKAGSINEFETKLGSWVATKTKTLLKAPANESQVDSESRCCKLKELLGTQTLLASTSNESIPAGLPATTSLEVERLEKAGLEAFFKRVVECNSWAELVGEEVGEKLATLKNKDKPTGEFHLTMTSLFSAMRNQAVSAWDQEDLCLESWDEGLLKLHANMERGWEIIGKPDDPKLTTTLHNNNVGRYFKSASDAYQAKKQQGKWKNLVARAKQYAEMSIDKCPKDDELFGVQVDKIKDTLKPQWESYCQEVREKLKDKNDELAAQIKEHEPCQYGTSNGEPWPDLKNIDLELEAAMKSFKKHCMHSAIRIFKAQAGDAKIETVFFKTFDRNVDGNPNLRMDGNSISEIR